MRSIFQRESMSDYFMRMGQVNLAMLYGGVWREQIHPRPASTSTRRDYGKPNEQAQQDAVAWGLFFLGEFPFQWRAGKKKTLPWYKEWHEEQKQSWHLLRKQILKNVVYLMLFNLKMSEQ